MVKASRLVPSALPEMVLLASLALLTEPSTSCEALMVLLVNVSVPDNVANVPVVGTVTLVLPVVVNVSELAPDVANVDPLARVNVPVVLEMVNPFSVVAVAAPNAPPTAAKVPDVGNVMLVLPDVVMVTALAPDNVSEAPDVPMLVMLWPLLSRPFFATNRFVVAMILYPLGG